jgi:DNA-nicking Smr family endonuclease
MGKRRQTASLAADPVSTEPVSAPSKAEPERMDFKEAMSSLKGLKPVQPQLDLPKPKPPVPPPAAAIEPPRRTETQEAKPEPPPPITETAVAKEPELARAAPVLIQLAAGMAIDVDGTLDLRGHSAVDAVERLKERILDAHLLGWRTFHIQLGPSEELRSAFQSFLASPEAEWVARYAQAPIPMGGAQAWILYLGTQTPAPH